MVQDPHLINQTGNMKLWMSAEMQLDVSDPYRGARKEIETRINSVIAEKPYGKDVERWSFIAIIREQDSPDYPELSRFTKHSRTAEFRLKLNHREFKQAGPIEQKRMIVASLIRSINMMPEIGANQIESKKLLEDVTKITSEAGWL